MSRFRERRAPARLFPQVAAADAEIDRLGYALYGLREEEIGIVGV
jgi:hypothetical protein